MARFIKQRPGTGKARQALCCGKFPSLQTGGPDHAGNRGVPIPRSALGQYRASLARWVDARLAQMPQDFPKRGDAAVADLGVLA